MPVYFAACDVFVLASTLEAAGNVLLEAMASARPVVCMASGGPSNRITIWADRLRLFPRRMRRRRRPDTPAPRFHRALGDRLGQNGRGMAQERFDSQRMTLDIVRIYQDVVADARNAVCRAFAGHNRAGMTRLRCARRA